MTENGILKRSSALLANFTHSVSRIADRGKNDSSKQGKAGSYLYRSETTGAPSKYSTFKGYLSLLSNVTGDHRRQPLRRSPSCQTLPIERKKSGARVKKSVSFSSDTSFQERRGTLGKSAVHEVKVYHKGVLQGTYASFIRSNLERIVKCRVDCAARARYRSSKNMVSQFHSCSRAMLGLARRSSRHCFLWKSFKRTS